MAGFDLVCAACGDLYDLKKIRERASGAIWGDDTPPFYAWFIKRNSGGERTHPIHMVERHFEHLDRLLFRDYLIQHRDVAEEYQRLKMRLADEYPDDRVAYTRVRPTLF